MLNSADINDVRFDHMEPVKVTWTRGNSYDGFLYIKGPNQFCFLFRKTESSHHGWLLEEEGAARHVLDAGIGKGMTHGWNFYQSADRFSGFSDSVIKVEKGNWGPVVI